MPTVCIDQTEYDALLVAVQQLTDRYNCLSQWETVEHRLITERVPLIICAACSPVSIINQIIAVQNTANSLLNDVTKEQQHIAILDAKLDECGIPELNPPAPNPVC